MIFGVLAPSGAGVAAAAHELLDHGPFTGIDAVTLAALFHGHRHSTGAPDHDHILVKPSSPARVADRVLAPQSSCPSLDAVPSPKVASLTFSLERRARATGSGPPPGISPLRV
jgi:hypothetical protein